jgi:hypothetical protein
MSCVKVDLYNHVVDEGVVLSHLRLFSLYNFEILLGAILHKMIYYNSILRESIWNAFFSRVGLCLDK